ncbi:MAG TPA: hypothetical protein VFR86_22565 [Burkholderiaceae bacterium]|nr:hypothetical protein [Burkholderiaceae bacterium]
MQTQTPDSLRCVAYDSQELVPGATRLEFFGAEPRLASHSATQRTESELVVWLMAGTAVRRLVLEELGLTASAKSFATVRAPFIENSNLKPGDIDLIACDTTRPDQAVVVEFKRVKVVGDDETENVNRLSALAGVAPQLKGLHALGFARTHLGAIAIVDGRGKESSHFLFRSTSDATYTRLMRAMESLQLPPEIGLLYVEIISRCTIPSRTHIWCASLHGAERSNGTRVNV